MIIILNIIVIALVLGMTKHKKRAENIAIIHKLRGQLANEKVEDKAKYGE